MTVSPRSGPAVFHISGYASLIFLVFICSSLKTRAITSLGLTANSTFLIGSCSRSFDQNKISLIEFNSESQQIDLSSSYSFGHAVLNVASYKGATNVFAALSGGISGCDSVLLARIPANKTEEDIAVVGKVSVNGGGRNLVMTSCDEIAVASTSGIMLVRPESTNASAIVANLDLVDCQAILSDCNRESTVVFAAGRSLLLWDTRTKGPSTILKTSHFFPILACDANPVLENVFVTGAADGRVLFWDIRQPNSTPLDELAAHNHHVTSVKYHPVHDQLLITSGTDCAVKLWRCQSVSSTPSKAYPLTEDSKSAAGTSSIADGLVEAFTRHEDSVYNCCWGSEGWSFASVSYDGTVMVNTVPRAEKYRIML